MKYGILLCACIAPVWAQPVHSPEVGTDRTVTFRLHAPTATEVSLTGEFIKGAKPLQKDAHGVWSVTVGPIEPEIYNYNFTIDGVKTLDPGNPNVKSGSTPSTIQSILEVRSEQPAFYDAQPVPHGEIRTHWYESKSLQTTRRLTVYTPPAYNPNANAKLPVLYLFHGANADETAWTRLGHVNLIMDNLIATGKSKPMLIVMPFGYGVPPGSTSPVAGGNTAAFSRDLLEDVIPMIEARYRVYNDREHRAIAGLSMGGGESLAIGLNHLELFGYVAGFSAGIRTAEFHQNYGTFFADPQKANQKLKLLWLGCGTDDSLFAASESLSKMLDEAKI
jgi:enterochelin esterase-like enzyme